MRITADNDSYKVAVLITVTAKKNTLTETLTEREKDTVVVRLGDDILRALERLPFAHNSICGGQIKVKS